MPTPPHAPLEAPPEGGAYLENARFEFGRLRRLAEAAIVQAPDDASLHHRVSPDTNSIAGPDPSSGRQSPVPLDRLPDHRRRESPDRNRESEFDPCDHRSREELLAEWDAAFALAEQVMSGLEPADLARTVRIRGEALLVREAIQRQIIHLAYHTGQIVLLARAATPDWTSLSIPRGASPDFRRRYKQ